MASSEKVETDVGAPAPRGAGTDGSPAVSRSDAQPRADAQTNERFDDILVRLRGVVEKLEGGNLSLEDSLKFFEDGIGLCRRGATILDSAERKVEVLLSGAAAGADTKSDPRNTAPRTAPFDVPTGDED